MKVLKVSKELQKYKSAKSDMTYFNIVAADKNEMMTLRCYQSAKFTMIRPGRSFKFIDVVVKGEECWVVSTSKIAFSAEVEVGAFTATAVLPEEEPPAGSKRTIDLALRSPQKSSVEGKIVEVSPLSFRMEGTLPVRCLGIKDETGVTKVALFDKLATQTYTAVTAVQVTSVYQKKYKDRQQLTTTKESSCQFISSSKLTELKVTEEDLDVFKSDPDFLETVKSEHSLTNLTIDCIYDAFTYKCCPQLTCRQKKLVDGKCPQCKGSSCKWTYRANVNIVFGDSQQQMTLFSKDLNCIFGTIENFSDDDVIEHLVRQLPKTFKARLSGKCLFDISL